MSSPGPILGIDLGTTNSLVAICEASGPRILCDREGRESLPSVVRYGANGTVEAIGHEARTHGIEFPKTTISSFKRLMGRSLDDARADLPYFSFDLAEGAHRTARVALPNGRGEAPVLVSPQEISAEILRSLRDRAARSLGASVHKAVITVPAYFDDAQRQATRDAGRLAGLDVVRIVNEPTAAALAYGIGMTRRSPETIAVFDLGGGTFDISLLRVVPGSADSAGGADFFQVLSTAGDTHLGGDDVDQMIIRLVLDEVGQQLGRPLEAAPATRQALRLLAEQTKIRLSDAETATIEVDLGASDAGAYLRQLRREELEVMMSPWIDRAMERCRRALRDAKLSAADIDRVVMVGGSTRIPLVRRRVAELFECEPYTALNPDTVVALGAAVQGAIMSGSTRDLLLLDVLPLSLGIETVGGAVAKLIMRNSNVPARATEMFSTSVDGQTSIKIHVLQGEREMVEDCRSLGEFHLRGIPAMPAGIPQLEVEFLVDANGVLSVSAHERRSGKRAQIQIVPNHGLTRDEVERMEAESFEHAREDMTRHRIVDLIANSTLDVKWIREQLDRIGDHLEPEYCKALTTLVDRLQEVIDRARADWTTVDPDEFHRLKEELDQASVRMHEISITRSLQSES